MRNVFANWVGLVFQLALSFCLTPLVVRLLGPTQFGLWAFITGSMGYYGLLDLGMRAGMTQYMARSLARRDYERANRVASTGVVALGICGLVAFVASCLLAGVLHRVLDVPIEYQQSIRWAVVIVGFSVAVQFLCFPFSAVFSATQRYDLSNALGMSSSMLGAILTYFALSNGHGLLGVAAATSFASTLGYIANCLVAFRLLPTLRISLGRARLSQAWEIVSFGVWSVLNAASLQLIHYSDLLVIGLFLPLEAVTPFALGGSLALHFDRVFRSAASVCFPEVTKLDAEGDKQQLRRFYLTGTRLMFCLAVTLAVVSTLWADAFFRIWVGADVAAGKGFCRIATIFSLLAVGAAVTCGQGLGRQVLLGTRRVRKLSVLSATEGVLNVMLSVLLAGPLGMGLFGVAVGTMAPAVICHGLVIPWFVAKLLDISMGQYLRDVLLRVGAMVAVQLIVIRVGHALLPNPESWQVLIACGVATALPCFAIMFLVGLLPEERQACVWNPLQRVVSIFRDRIRPAAPVTNQDTETVRPGEPR
jgi:O-antigen/teichoic acid export membrane protein